MENIKNSSCIIFPLSGVSYVNEEIVITIISVKKRKIVIHLFDSNKKKLVGSTKTGQLMCSTLIVNV